MGSTTVGEQFLEANVKADSVKARNLLAEDIVMLGNSPRQRASGKAYLMIATKDNKNDWKISYFLNASAPFQENK
jgi:hypothetical protein